MSELSITQAIQSAIPYETEGPQPLVRELPKAIEFPISALGQVLQPAALAIHDMTQAPLALCGQSVLAAATLALQAHADVEMPHGGAQPLSNFFVTVAASGERKSSVDRLALAPINERQKQLKSQHDKALSDYKVKSEAWQAARNKALKSQDSMTGIEADLRALGAEPCKPRGYVIKCSDWRPSCLLMPRV